MWFDEFELTAGDSLRRSIDRGLSGSRFCRMTSGVLDLSVHLKHERVHLGVREQRAPPFHVE